MQSTDRAEDELIQKPLHAYNEKKREKKRVDITKLAQEYKVPYQRLQHRIMDQDSKSTREYVNAVEDYSINSDFTRQSLSGGLVYNYTLPDNYIFQRVEQGITIEQAVPEQGEFNREAERAAAEQAEQEGIQRETVEREAAAQAERDGVGQEIEERAPVECIEQELVKKTEEQAERDRLTEGAAGRAATERVEQERAHRVAEATIRAEQEPVRTGHSAGTVHKPH
ncbi:hypothetical protein BBP40_005606 [Aspergillus hancockii]|nr:hypothetical protein BBP40_005606 [Aspergillus hancockii]